MPSCFKYPTTISTKPIISVFIFFYIPLSPTLSQEKSKFEITQVNIPGINIRCLTEDARGFLWIGTQDGLIRFDSKNSKLYNKGNDYKSAIGGSDIRDIVESRDAIWITSTQGGLDKISKTTSNPLLHISQAQFPGLGNNTITSLLTQDSIIYIGTEKGLYKYQVAENTITMINLGKDHITPYIDKLAVFENYLVITIRDWGCLSYNMLTGKTVSDCPTTRSGQTHHRFYAMTACSQGQWLLGTSQGINKLTINKAGKLAFEKIPFPYVKEGIDTDVYAIESDKDKNLWFSNENNLIKIDPNAHTSIIVENARESSTGFLNNIYKIYCDKENNVWLCCQIGLFYLKNTPASILNFQRSNSSMTRIPHAYYLFPLNDSIVLVTAENGLYKVNTNLRSIDAIDVSQVYDFVFLDPFNRLLVSNKTGLQQLAGRSLTPIHKVYPEFRPFAVYTINSAVRINNAEIVMGTENNKGILIWNFINHSIANITTRSHGIQLDNNIINGIYKIRENIFCVLSESSLIYVDYYKKTSKRIHFLRNNGREEYALFFDMCRVKDLYYLSSYGNGVLVLDTSFRIKRIISSDNGLSNNSVYKLLPWKDSLLFMTTNLGLNVLNIRTGGIRQFYKNNGLHDDVFEETSGNIYSNKIYAGGPNGFTVIYPGNLTPNPSGPLLYINNLTINLPDKIIDTINFETTQFSIPNNALQTNVNFSGINYRNPERTTYTYKIAELHTNWIPLGTRNFITLMGVSPGTYHLQVQAFNEDGLPGKIKELILIFQPKWYQTWWFKLSLLALALGGVYGFYRIRIHQFKKVQEIRNKLASDLHDDLGSTMNSVKIYANLALMNKASENYLLKVKESTQEAIVGIRDMIWVLDDKKDDLEHLFTRLNSFAAPVCEANAITYAPQIADDARTYKLGQEERRNLYMILKEAINNAIKYAAGSHLQLNFGLKKGQPEITIKDDGKGFDIEKTNDGNGLKNMTRRAREIKYHFQIVSDPGNGTVIYLQKM